MPTDIQQPGTQPGEVGNLESPDKCVNCHGGYDPAVEPARIDDGDPEHYSSIQGAYDAAGNMQTV